MAIMEMAQYHHNIFVVSIIKSGNACCFLKGLWRKMLTETKHWRSLNSANKIKKHDSINVTCVWRVTHCLLLVVIRKIIELWNKKKQKLETQIYWMAKFGMFIIKSNINIGIKSNKLKKSYSSEALKKIILDQI
jgi:hypothetical protein